MTLPKKASSLLILIVLLVIVGVFAVKYFGFLKSSDYKHITTTTSDQKQIVPDTTKSTSNQSVSVSSPPPSSLQIVPVASSLKIPWSIVFLDNDTLFVSERVGNILQVNIANGAKTNIYSFAEVHHEAEAGLMGLAISPDFQIDKTLFACLAYKKAGSLKNKVVALSQKSGSWQLTSTLIDDIPAARFHAGCRLLISFDKKIFITTGDALEKSKAQDKSFLGGKILRLNLDGSIPTDNPFLDSPVYSFGHRNPQGLSFVPQKNILVSSEHGPSLIDGPAGGDEINLISAGGNYGWPLVSHEKNQLGLIAPLAVYTPAIAPASALVYSGKMFASWREKLFVGGLQAKALLILTFSDDFQQIISTEKLAGSEKGRIRDVVEAPDGSIYFTTSNTDGRGNPANDDDKIYRIFVNSQ